MKENRKSCRLSKNDPQNSLGLSGCRAVDEEVPKSPWDEPIVEKRLNTLPLPRSFNSCDICLSCVSG